jgi:FkbM family methyltransferase
LPDRYYLPGTYYKYKLIGMPEEEIQLLPKLIVRGGVAIDVGANIGLYSYALSKVCDAVEAFEPNPKNQKIIRAYNAPNIKVHGVALSSEDGVGALHIPVVSNIEIHGHATLNSNFPHQKTIQVDLKKLDEYKFANVNFIKVDVEGHELDVLKGAKDTIERYRPVILVEIEQRHLSFPMSDVFEEVLSYGYKGSFLYQNERHDLSKFSYEQYQKPFLEGNHEKNTKYVNNFIFEPIGT